MSETEYKAVRGLMRGLTLINDLNRFDGGASTAQLAEQSGLHRTTVRRLLETLQAEGYVRRSESDDSYRLMLKVRELSEGFRDEQWISSIAAPLLGELLQQVAWPTDLCTLDGDAMVIRETTHRFSRLSFHRSMVGRRLPLLMTATGRAYFAFCPVGEREELIEIMISRDDEQSVLARDQRFIERLVEHTLNKGYGENHAHWGQERKIAAIATPILREQRVMGCLNLVYIAKAMPIEEAARRYLGAMQGVVGKIEAGLVSV
jgi:IclR family transcriptional regulator, mhp operon transcriptional activator